MPRTSSSKRQQGANGNHSANSQAGNHAPAGNSGRDVRSDNAPLGPGRRVAKSPSPSQLNVDAAPAQAQAQAQAHVDTTTFGAASPLSPLPATYSTPACANGFATNPSLAAAAAAAAVAAFPAVPDHCATEGFCASLGHDYLESASAGSLVMSPPASSAAYMPPVVLADEVEVGHRHINVNDAKNHNVHRDPGPIEMALNVLRSCPLQDTIAILIILMNVPPSVLTLVSMLFTFLTFVVPPVTTSSGLSIAEILDGNQGTPSLTTLLCMDVVMLGIWLFLWAPMQQFIVDLSQVVISLTLGGGGSSRHGVARNIAFCVALVGASQWTSQLRVLRLSQLGPLLGRAGSFLHADVDDPMETPAFNPFEKQGRYGWVRSMFAIHIVTQGLVRYIREWYLRREKRDLLSQSQLDPEAGKALLFSSTESSTDGSVPLANDCETGAQAAPTTITNKKRRKQSALVRIRQPLWAALASTKIVMVKEYELSHAADESAGSNATDIHNLGNATFNRQPEQIWICFIGAGEVCFNTSSFPDTRRSEAAPYSEDRRVGVPDRSKPFYVRVNQAVWQPTRIVPIEGGEEEGLDGMQWTGDIYGLTPLSHYECEFVRTTTDEVIFSTSLRTIAAKTTGPDASARPASGQRSRHRHDSPATTLRASINVAETELACKKTQLKTVRKENHRKVASIRKEIEKLTTSAQAAGGNDDKLRQKAAQNRNLKGQAEDACRALEKRFKEVESMPPEVQRRHGNLRRKWVEEKARFHAARGAFKAFMTNLDREVKALEDEVVSLEAKRNKIATRIAKADDDHKRITKANRHGLNEAQRRWQERADYETEMRRIEAQYRAKIDMLQNAIDKKQSQIMFMTQQLQTYLASFQQDGSTAATAAGSSYEQQQPPPQQQQQQPQASPVALYSTPSWGPTLAPTGHFGSASSVPAPYQPPMWPLSSMPAGSQGLTCSSLASTAHAPPFSHSPQTATSASKPSSSSTTTTTTTTTTTNTTPTNGNVARTPPHPLKVRGRSSSMLSDVSGFTQQSGGDDDNSTGAGHNNVNPMSPPLGLGYGHSFHQSHQSHQSHHSQPVHAHPFGPVGSPYGPIRPPPGLGLPQAQSEGSSFGSESGRGNTPASGASEEGEDTGVLGGERLPDCLLAGWLPRLPRLQTASEADVDRQDSILDSPKPPPPPPPPPPPASAPSRPLVEARQACGSVQKGQKTAPAMCTWYYLHHHHLPPCPRPIDIVVHWVFCADAPASASSLSPMSVSGPRPPACAGPAPRDPCANTRHDAGAPPLNPSSPCASGGCLVSPACTSGACRLAQLRGRWRCCACGRGGNEYRWCRHRMPKCPDTFCYHLCCGACVADPAADGRPGTDEDMTGGGTGGGLGGGQGEWDMCHQVTYTLPCEHVRTDIIYCPKATIAAAAGPSGTPSSSSSSSSSSHHQNNKSHSTQVHHHHRAASSSSSSSSSSSPTKAKKSPCARLTLQSQPYPTPPSYAADPAGFGASPLSPRCPLPDCPYERKNRCWHCCWCGKGWNVTGRCGCVMLVDGHAVRCGHICCPQCEAAQGGRYLHHPQDGGTGLATTMGE
ncbi:hypothetical protein P8C59_004032 [Phyllachora maydis]|uniref:Ubiquitination network signaling protein n=1 Tax=Phyllachora maydis TaxID=1825666 RepID=A0AAD9MC13_9PEZI|nr:hypothetical protein P8C59_004032 [Phyllachora maydis]